MFRAFLPGSKLIRTILIVCTISVSHKADRKMPSRKHSTEGIAAGNVSSCDVRAGVCAVNPDPAIAPGVDVKKRSRQAVAARVGNRSRSSGGRYVRWRTESPGRRGICSIRAACGSGLGPQGNRPPERRHIPDRGLDYLSY